jgi:hypothetical protein
MFSSYRYLSKSIRNSQISTADGALFKGHEFYTSIENFLKAHTSLVLEELQRQPLGSESLLNDYVATWKCYQSSSKVFNGLCTPLNLEVRKCKGKAIHQIDQLALNTWRESLFKQIENQMTNTILHFIERDRAGQPINCELVKAALGCYTELGKC